MLKITYNRRYQPRRDIQRLLKKYRMENGPFKGSFGFEKISSVGVQEVIYVETNCIIKAIPLNVTIGISDDIPQIKYRITKAEITTACNDFFKKNNCWPQMNEQELKGVYYNFDHVGDFRKFVTWAKLKYEDVAHDDIETVEE